MAPVHSRQKPLPLRPIGIGHNGGPPLREKRHQPEWGRGGVKTYFEWRRAHRRAWRLPREIAIRRDDKAEALGLTFEEYHLELLERGRYLQAEDHEAVAAIKAKRKRRKG